MARTAGASNPHVTSRTPTSSQVEGIDYENTLKVETRVRTPLGLPIYPRKPAPGDRAAVHSPE
jgi:hypothetical protein